MWYTDSPTPVPDLHTSGRMTNNSHKHTPNFGGKRPRRVEAVIAAVGEP